MVKDDWVSSEESSNAMGFPDLDWSPQHRQWGKLRQDGQGEPCPSSSADFHIRPGETCEDALRRVHNVVQERFEHEYVQREQGAYALAKEERERELMSQYGRELKAGVEAGQRREQECLQALFNTELARDQDVE